MQSFEAFYTTKAEGIGIEVAELSVFTWPGYSAGLDLHKEVRPSLVELADERPEALQLMRGRTFARAVH